MTNGEAILKNLTVDDLVIWIRKTYCAEQKCKDCPLGQRYCTEIFDQIEAEADVPPSGDEVIRYWLNDGKDYMFYSHVAGSKKWAVTTKEKHHNFRNKCSRCGCFVNTRGLASVSLSNVNQAYKMIGKICGECFPHLCKAMKIGAPDFVEPYFEVKKLTQKRRDKTYCGECGAASPPKYNFCPKCGTALDK